MNKNHFHFFLAILLLLFTESLWGQDSLSQYPIYPEGITFEYGIGSYAVTDEYISTEKYSGSMPYYRILWTKPHDDYVYHLGIDYRDIHQI